MSENKPMLQGVKFCQISVNDTKINFSEASRIDFLGSETNFAAFCAFIHFDFHDSTQMFTCQALSCCSLSNLLPLFSYSLPLLSPQPSEKLFKLSDSFTTCNLLVIYGKCLVSFLQGLELLLSGHPNAHTSRQLASVMPS